MSATRTPKLIAALRETLQRVEQTSGVQPDDPALVELKSILHRRVALLERGISQDRETRHPLPTRSNSIVGQETESAISS